MRYAIVSDIHANLQAWNAVLLDIRSDTVDEIICLGDIVGYGPNPAEVLQSVHANVDHVVLGNHDAVISRQLDDELFNDDAQDIIRWTREQLNDEATRFLQTLPLSLDGGSFRCAHGEFAEPDAFNYVFDPGDALPSWNAVDAPILFAGHTHNPSIFILGASGTPRSVEAQDFVVEPGKRFLVTVGSVGQPRNRDARAWYCVYDTSTQSVFWRRVPFDLDAYRKALDEAGIPEKPSHFLRCDPRAGHAPVREQVDFAPPKVPEQKARDAVPVQELVVLERRATRWKRVALSSLCVGLVLAASAGAWWWQYHTRGLDIADPDTAAVSATATQSGSSLLTQPADPVPEGKPIYGWSIRLGDRRRQGASVVAADTGYQFVLRSGSPSEEIRLTSRPVEVEPGMKLCLEGSFRKNDGFEGQVDAVVSLIKGAGATEESIDPYLVKQPAQARKGGWAAARQTFTLPAGARQVRLHVRGEFRGEVRIKDLRLTRVD